MRKYLFKRRLRKSKRTPTPSPSFLDKLNSVNLIAEIDRDGRDGEITAFERKLRNTDCEVNFLGFLDQKPKEQIEFPFQYYDKSALNWYGVPKSDELENFYRRTVDVTLVANPRDLPHMDYVAYNCDSVLHLGMDTTYGDYQDIYLRMEKPELKKFLIDAWDLLRELQLINAHDL